VAVRKAVWLCKLLAGLFGHEMDSTVIHFDNQTYVKLSENPVFHDKLKHIEIKYHYIRDMVQRKAVHVQYLSTHEQVAYVFTKSLARTKFEYFHARLGLVENVALCDILLVVLLWIVLRRFVSESSCDGCASDSGLSCDDVWSLVYSFGLSGDNLRWSPALYSFGLS
jgi:hypothetical protein